MTDPVPVVLVGVGGYGEVYLSSLLDEPLGRRCHIVGAVDPKPERCSRLAELEGSRVPIYRDLEAFHAERSATLAVVSSPIHLHAEQTCQVLRHGSHVLLEKPAAAVPADVDRMIEVRDETDRFVAVGFQWSFASSILQLKRDILAGRFGIPYGGRSLTLWSRAESYYRRNDWAGRKRDAAGRWILDSPVCNAMAHDLHNMLFLLGESMDRSADPVGVTQRIARVNDIETFDTIAARVVVRGGAEILFLASHAIGQHEEAQPRFALQFEQATVTFPGEMAPITAVFHDGTTSEYASPYSTPQVSKLWITLDAVNGIADIQCGLEAARPHSVCVASIDAAATEVLQFPADLVRESRTMAGKLRWVEGLASSFVESYSTGDWPALLA